MIILDVEIKKAILGKNEIPLPGIEYCNGWRDFAGMGVACVCTYDIVTHLSRVFLEEDLKELAEYLNSHTTAGFNTKHFDLPLLREHAVSVDFGPAPNGGAHYDIVEQFGIALGYHTDRPVRGWNLNDVCTATLGISKADDGALMPVWWQQGQRGKVINHCLNDVWMEGQLLLHIIKGGIVTNGKESIRVQPPEGVRYTYYADPNTAYPIEPEQPTIGARYGATQAAPGATAVTTPLGGLGIIR